MYIQQGTIQVLSSHGDSTQNQTNHDYLKDHQQYQIIIGSTTCAEGKAK